MRKHFIFILAIVSCCGFMSTGAAQTQPSLTEGGRKVVRRVEPRYPEVARRMNLGGTVRLVAVVATDGSVKKVEPVGGSPVLVEAAQGAIQQWKFVPGAESREPVELHFTP